MQLSPPPELLTILHSEVARYRRLLEHAEGYIAALEGSGSSAVATAKIAPSVTLTPRKPILVRRHSDASANKNEHRSIMAGSQAALCRDALQEAGRPMHYKELFVICQNHGAKIKQPAYLQSVLYRHKQTFTPMGAGMWSLNSAAGSTGEQLSFNGNAR